MELVTFTARSQGADAVLFEWTTATERQNAGFEIEQLVEQQWQSVAWIAGRGDSEVTVNYRHLLRGLSAGTHTFRLQQEDYDGSRTASEAVSVRINAETGTVIAPNPAAAEAVLTLTLPTDDERVTITLLDGFGRQLRVLHSGAFAAGTQALPLDLSNTPSGLYYVRIRSRTLSSVLPLQRL